MIKYLVLRLLTAIPTVLAVLLITFTLTFFSPFDPVRQMLANAPVKNMDTPEMIARVRHQYGLDQPFWVQFGNFLKNLIQGNFGVSINGQRDILAWIKATLPISAQLGLAAAFLTLLLGIPLGALAARLSELDSAREMVVFCKGGTRSARALELLVSAGFRKVKNLQGGINAWAREIDPQLPLY